MIRYIRLEDIIGKGSDIYIEVIFNYDGYFKIKLIIFIYIKLINLI
jgi:hypothetical protein